MRICSIILATTLLLPAVEDYKEIRKQEYIQKDIERTTLVLSNKANDLIDSIQYNNIESIKNIGLEEIRNKLQTIAIDDKSISMVSVNKHLTQARKTIDDKELQQASQEQSIITDNLNKIVLSMEQMNVANIELQSLIDKQKNINDKTQKLAEKTLGKEKQELTSQEKKELEDLAKQQEDINKSLDNIDNKTKQDIKDAANDINENKLAEAMPKQEDLLKKLEDMQQNMKSNNEKESKDSKSPSEKSKSKDSKSPSEKSELDQDVLNKIEQTKWNLNNIPLEREILQQFAVEKFPKKYAVELRLYYLALTDI